MDSAPLRASSAWEILDLLRMRAAMRGHSSHPSAFLDSSCAQCHPSPIPPRTTHTPLVVFQLPEREEGAWGPWPGIPCLPSPSLAQLLASAPPQLDSNPLEAAANSAESSNLQGLHKLAFSAKCSPGEEEEELGSRGWGWGSVAEHSTSAAHSAQTPPLQVGTIRIWWSCPRRGEGAGGVRAG